MVNIHEQMSGWTTDVFERQTDLAGVVMRLGRQFGLHGKGWREDCTQEAVLYALGFGTERKVLWCHQPVRKISLTKDERGYRRSHVMVTIWRLKVTASLFLFIFGHATWFVGYYFPNQGSNPGPGSSAMKGWSPNHWTTREFLTAFLEGPGKGDKEA